jgi:hypothetical protein
MGIEEITHRVTSYINLSLSGNEAENPKVDFKRHWYNMQDTKSLMEFLKDTSAIANTFGPDGFIIIGYDDRTKDFHECNFSDSGKKDTSEITDVINKNIDRLFSIHYYEVNILGHRLGVLHIPPSIDKPHVIRNYKTFKGPDQVPNEHRIFTRKGTSTRIATKYDIDLMYYDQKNIQAEYELYVSFSAQNISFYQPIETQNLTVPIPIRFRVTLYIENTGRRPVSITALTFTISEYEDPSENEVFTFNGQDSGFSASIIQSGVLGYINCDFCGSELFNTEKRKDISSSLKINFKRLGSQNLVAILSNGENVNCKLSITI